MSAIIKKSNQKNCGGNAQDGRINKYIDKSTNVGQSLDEVQIIDSECRDKQEIKEANVVRELNAVIEKLNETNDVVLSENNALKNKFEEMLNDKVNKIVEQKIEVLRDEVEREKEETLKYYHQIFGDIHKKFEAALEVDERDLKEILFVSLLNVLKKEYGNEFLEGILREVMVSFKTARSLDIFLSEKDYTEFGSALGEMLKGANAGLYPDERIQLGGCIVRTDETTLDKRLETQLDAFKAILLNLEDES